MNYPVWQLPFPGGILIALVAVTHVFVSHFAIGGGAFLVLSERRAYRENDPSLLAYVRRHSRFFALLTLVFGALTGVGIWFTIGLVSPEATSSLIHTFVWGWAIEWVFFFVEIIAAIVYAKSWDKLPARDHLIVGWIYLVAAWLSLVVINGIITFMLTPGNWLQTKRLRRWLFQSHVLSFSAVAHRDLHLLAGAFGLVTVGRQRAPSAAGVPDRRRSCAWWGGRAGVPDKPYIGWSGWKGQDRPLGGAVDGVGCIVAAAVGRLVLPLHTGISPRHISPAGCRWRNMSRAAASPLPLWRAFRPGVRRVEAALDAYAADCDPAGARLWRDRVLRVPSRTGAQALGNRRLHLCQRCARRVR